MENRTRLIVGVCLTLIISCNFGCQSIIGSDRSQKISVTFEEPARARFSGKGAGAGMMMMASMGAMGIAIGVAIDEGIGKDIQASMTKEKIDVEQIIVKAFDHSSGKQKADLGALSIHVTRYGFLLRPGENDPVSAQIHMEISNENKAVTEEKNAPVKFAFPEEYQAVDLKTVPLEQLKTKGADAGDLLAFAARTIADAYFEKN